MLKARWFRDCKGDKFYVSPDVTTIPTTQAAQNYSDEVTRALEAAGFKVMKLVLSKNVHNCYKLAECENANLPYLATHPCIAWSDSVTLRGNIAEIQEFYAKRAVYENPDKYLNLTEALQSLNFDAALNKKRIIEWLATLHIDYTTLRIRSFVHLQFEFCVEIFQLLCNRVDCDPKKLLTSRRWFLKDTLNCEHGMMRCQCLECVCDRQKCSFKDCKLQPSFNFPGQPAKFCLTHQEDGMEKVKVQKCSFKDCMLAPSFNFPGQPAKFCSTHQEPGMENVRDKKCSFKDCMLAPSFNFPGQPAKFCSTHREPGMENVKVQKCSFKDCMLQPSFNFPGQPAKFCSTHQEPGMENVRDKKCSFKDCMLRPSFNFPGQPAKFCSTHQEDGMENVIYKRSKK